MAKKAADELSVLIASFGPQTAKSETDKSFVWVDYQNHLIAVFPKKGGVRTVFSQTEERNGVIWTSNFVGKSVVTDEDKSAINALFK